MTSVLKRYSQIDARTKYFIITTNDIPIDYYMPANPTAFTGGVTDITNVLVPNPNKLSGRLKDLGRTVYVYDASVALPDDNANSPGPQVAILREVQVVDGPQSEGVSGVPTNNFKSYWIATWVADDDGTYEGAVTINLAHVARAG